MTAPREPIEHELKTLPEFYRAVEDGSKTFEVRTNDRDFRVGDTLRLLEFLAPTGFGPYIHGQYTSRGLRVRVTYIATPEFSPPGKVVMGIQRLTTDGRPRLAEVEARYEHAQSVLLKVRRALCGDINNMDDIVEMAALVKAEATQPDSTIEAMVQAFGQATGAIPHWKHMHPADAADERSAVASGLHAAVVALSSKIARRPL